MNEMDHQVHVTEAEWEVMRVVWSYQEATSQQVIAALGDKHQWKPATIKTLLGRLVKKGLLTTEAEGKKFIYQAAVPEQQIIQQATSSLLEHVCNKKVGKTIGSLIDEATLSFADIDLLVARLEEKKKVAVKEVHCDCIKGQCNCTVDI